MEQGYQMTVNRLPSPTWNWPHMNESSLSDMKPVNRGVSLTVQVPEGIAYSCARRTMQFISGGMGPDMDRLLDDAGADAHVLAAREGWKQEEPVFLHMEYEEHANGIHAVEIVAPKDSSVTVVMDLTSRSETGAAAVQIKMHAGKHAKIRLIQVQLLGERFLHLNDVGAECEQGGSVEVLQLILGAERTYSGCLANLAGEKSSAAMNVGYLGQNRQRIDLNYAANHRGIQSESRMRAHGVLRGEAFKLFRGTIDFQRGASDAIGEETEDVLLLDDTVVNQTIPLILCGEENVQGNHGATIGKLDEDMLFYLCARGLTKEAAVNQVARARFDALNREIPSKTAQTLVNDYLKGVFGDGME